LIDLCRWLFGEIAEAVAVMRTPIAQRPDANGELHKCDAEDGFVASLKTETGVTGVIDCAVEAAVSTPEHTAVFGATGMLENGDTGGARRRTGGEEDIFEVALQGKTPLIYSMERWASIICDTVRSGVIEADSPTFEDGLACARVMDQMGRGV